MQGLVAIGPRDGDVILEAPGHRLVDAVHETQGPITGVIAIDDHAKAIDVDHLMQGNALRAHLAVDAVQVLLASLDAAVDPGLRERALERDRDRLQEFLLVAARLLELPFQHLVAVGVQRHEPQVLEFKLDRVQAQALGDRGVDLERLTRDAPSLQRRHCTERAHVVHPVGELDHDHADVAHHREQHLAEALRLRLGAVFELDLVEFADAIDEIGDHLTEHGDDLGLGRGRVLDDVVQDRGDQRIGIEVQVGEDVGDRNGVRDIRLAREPLLALVALGAEFVRLAHPLDLRGRQVRFKFF